MVEYEEGSDGGGASGIGSDEAIPCGCGVKESSGDGLGEDLIKHFNMMG